LGDKLEEEVSSDELEFDELEVEFDGLEAVLVKKGGGRGTRIFFI
jgi:Na+-translocating ferredoxin:NAD+ oxidoreductase RnfG subunit